MDIEKALINDGLRVSKLYSEFRIPTIYNFAVKCAILLKVAKFLTVSIVFSVYK